MLTQPVAVLTAPTRGRVRVWTLRASLIRAARYLADESPGSLLNEHGGALSYPMKRILSAGPVWGEAPCTLLEAHTHPASCAGLEPSQLLAERSRVGLKLDDESLSLVKLISHFVDFSAEAQVTVVRRRVPTTLWHH
jgi:hypothetical protein